MRRSCKDKAKKRRKIIDPTALDPELALFVQQAEHDDKQAADNLYHAKKKKPLQHIPYVDKEVNTHNQQKEMRKKEFPKEALEEDLREKEAEEMHREEELRKEWEEAARKKKEKEKRKKEEKWAREEEERKKEEEAHKREEEALKKTKEEAHKKDKKCKDDAMRAVDDTMRAVDVAAGIGLTRKSTRLSELLRQLHDPPSSEGYDNGEVEMVNL
ncbi:hypothetical protein ABW21_db0209757 [Orbilia brochopaga]|nr:hypothetical protein ABW21_db0209757 [Drechslerella brochopaga]